MEQKSSSKERELLELRIRVAQLEAELNTDMSTDTVASTSEETVSGLEVPHEYGDMIQGVVEITESSDILMEEMGAEPEGDDQSDQSITTKSSSNRRIGRYPCPTCGRKFPFQSELRRHTIIHRTPDERNALKKLVCEVCSKRFVWNCDLQRHIVTHGTERAHVCSVCSAAFKLPEGLRKHMVIHSEDSAKCDQCSRTYKTKDSLLAHSCHRSRSRCKKGSFPCETCGKVFTRKDLLLVHRRIHTGELPYACVVCDKGFVTASKCSTHLATHRGKPYVCTDCKKCFATPTALQSHLGIDEDTWTHSLALTDVRLTHCNKGGVVLVQVEIVIEQCDDDTAPPTRLLPAVTIVTFPAPLLPPPCPFCSDDCSDDSCHDADSLADHMLLHMSPYPDRCDTCKQGFQHSDDLAVHQCTRPSSVFDCEHCSETFTTYCEWAKHIATAHSVKRKKPLVNRQTVEMITEAGSKRFKCEQCNKSFSLLPSLRVHMHTHTGRFQCSDCERCFATATKLKEHIFIHTGERPFKCEECEKCFKCSTDRRRHIEESHLGLRRHCDVCNKEFKRGAYLSHMRRAHPIPSTPGSDDPSTTLLSSFALMMPTDLATPTTLVSSTDLATPTTLAKPTDLVTPITLTTPTDLEMPATVVVSAEATPTNVMYN